MGSNMSQKYRKTLKFFSLSALACSQIWLIPLMDDSPCGYVTKLKKIKKTTWNTLPCWG